MELQNNSISLDDIDVGKVLIFPIRDELAKQWQLKQVQLVSYNSLFQSYIIKDYDFFNEFNLDNFLEKYTQLRLDNDYIKDIIIKESLKDLYQYIDDNFFFGFEINFDKKVLLIGINKRKEVE